MSRWFAQKDAAAMAAVFEHPLPIYAEDTFKVLQNREDIHAATVKFLRNAQAAAVKDLLPKTAEIEDHTDNRCLAYVEWSLVHGDGSLFNTIKCRYVLRRSTLCTHLRIEMIETLQSGFPTLCAHPQDSLQTLPV